MKRLEPLVGKWKLETPLADVQAIARFEWILGGLFLLQRTEVDHPERPTAIPQAFLINRRRTSRAVSHQADARTSGLSVGERGLANALRRRVEGRQDPRLLA